MALSDAAFLELVFSIKLLTKTVEDIDRSLADLHRYHLESSELQQKHRDTLQALHSRLDLLPMILSEKIAQLYSQQSTNDAIRSITGGHQLITLHDREVHEREEHEKKQEESSKLEITRGMVSARFPLDPKKIWTVIKYVMVALGTGGGVTAGVHELWNALK